MQYAFSEEFARQLDQQDLLKDFRDYRFNIILKARQLGISTISAAYVAWLMLFHKDKNILVVIF